MNDLTREDVCKALNEAYNNIDSFFDDVEFGDSHKFETYVSAGDSFGSGDILILCFKTKEFISWYKLTHVGRDLHTNLETYEDVVQFFKSFKDSIIREEENEDD